MSERNGVSRPPDFNLLARDRETGREGQVGVAWINPDGSIGLKLNFNTVIDTTIQDLSLLLFPRKGRTGEGHEEGRHRRVPDRSGTAG
jgi:hypothetical protein